MSAAFYNLLHVFGILLAFVALGGATVRALGGGGDRDRKLVGITHGVALALILVGGFGLLAKLDYGFPSWAWAKILIWLIVGALPMIIRRLPQHATFFWFAIPVLGGLAAYIALYKPF